MPTTRQRYTLTETDDLAAALRDAARRWPEDRDSPARLLAHLLRAGHEAITQRWDDDLAARRRGVADTAGALTGAFPPNYLDELRDEWPA